MAQLCGPGAIQGAPAGPAGPAGIRAGPRVRLAKQFYPENPDIDAQGAYINTRCGARRGVHGVPGSIRQQFYRKIPILTRKGRVLTRDQLF